MINHLKSLPGEVYLHLLADYGVKVQRILVLLTPFRVVLTELTV